MRLRLRRRTSDQAQAGKPRQVGHQIVADAARQVGLLAVAPQRLERQHRDRERRRLTLVADRSRVRPGALAETELEARSTAAAADSEQDAANSAGQGRAARDAAGGAERGSGIARIRPAYVAASSRSLDRTGAISR